MKKILYGKGTSFCISGIARNNPENKVYQIQNWDKIMSILNLKLILKLNH